MSPQPITAKPAAWRHHLLIACFALIGMAICARLIQLQGFGHSKFAQKVAKQSVVRESVQARPGDLFDRHGRLLATTITSRSLFLVPSKIGNSWEVSNQISDALAIDGDQLFERLALNQA
jgi:cell division protein FtsI (penicillin-binding protein 3)